MAAGTTDGDEQAQVPRGRHKLIKEKGHLAVQLSCGNGENGNDGEPVTNERSQLEITRGNTSGEYIC